MFKFLAGEGKKLKTIIELSKVTYPQLPNNLLHLQKKFPL